MRSIRKAMHAGVALGIVALAFSFVLNGIIPVQASVEDSESKDISVKDISDKTHTLDKKISQLIEVSEEKIEHYSNLYNELYDKDLRLTHKHITYSSRLVSKKENFIKDNIHKNDYREQPLYLDLRSRSAVTSYEIEEYILKGTALEGLGDAFVRAELNYGVNAIFLLSLGIHESSWGKSSIAKNKNNLFGFGAYDKSPYASAVMFSTKSAGIDRVARHLSETYLVEGGRYFSGGYTLSDVNKIYASDPKWASKIAKTMDNINKEIMTRQDMTYHQQIYVIGEDENGKEKYSSLFTANID